MNKATYVAISVCALMFAEQSFAYEKFMIGRTVNVACKSIRIHMAPSGFSKVSKEMKFGNRVKITSFEGMFELSKTDESSKIQLEAQNHAFGDDNHKEKINPKDYTRASWVGLQGGGYTSAACLLPDYLFESATEEQMLQKARAKIKNLKLTTAQKNFSENEEGDLVAMKGAAGGVAVGKPNYKMVDDYIRKSQGLAPFKEVMAFRQNGGLGK